MKALFTFHTTADALNGERFLRGKGVFCTVIPVPRSLQGSCNYAAEAEGDDPCVLARLLREENIDFAGMFRITEEAGKERYEVIQTG